MKYRKFGKLNWKVSALGLGTAGLLRLKEEQAVKVICTAIDSGINFIDIGWPLVEKNNEQLFTSLNNAFRDNYRQKVKLAVTLPPATINKAADFDRALEDLLKNLKADSIEFLMLGGLNRFTWARLQELHIIKSLEKSLKDKKIGYAGFYFHDQYQFLREIVEAYDNWSLCQFQYSFMDIDHHPGYGGLKYAADKDLAVIAAKPLLAGRLEHNIPKTVSEIWSAAEPKRSPAEWALRWVWNHPEIATVVSDMDTVELIKSFNAIADTALPDSFSVPDELVVGKARDAYFALKPIPCTACRGCMPCTNGIDVPRVFEIFNDAHMYGNMELARFIFSMEHHDAAACTECGTCVCGKKIPIPDWLKKAQALLGDNE